MDHWNYILAAYGVTVVLMIVEIVAARARRRAAAESAAETQDPRLTAVRSGD
jgi:heme exporter protein D